jgi:hypothetical protein
VRLSQTEGKAFKLGYQKVGEARALLTPERRAASQPGGAQGSALKAEM